MLQLFLTILFFSASFCLLHLWTSATCKSVCLATPSALETKTHQPVWPLTSVLSFWNRAGVPNITPPALCVCVCVCPPDCRCRRWTSRSGSACSRLTSWLTWPRPSTPTWTRRTWRRTGRPSSARWTCCPRDRPTPRRSPWCCRSSWTPSTMKSGYYPELCSHVYVLPVLQSCCGQTLSLSFHQILTCCILQLHHFKLFYFILYCLFLLNIFSFYVIIFLLFHIITLY